MTQRGWIRDVVNACLAAGIREYVICAGARNMPLVTALSDAATSGEMLEADELRLYHHFDERAAGFFALGRTVATGAACAVVTTSGTAVGELLPAIIEAHYQKRPLVIISADRGKSFRGTGAPQAIEQVGIFSNYVQGCEDIEWQDQITLLDGWSGHDPWHVNVCIEESELADEEIRPSKVRLGEVGADKLPLDVRPVLDCIKNAWKGLVVVLGGLEPEDREEVWHFLKNLGAPVLADSTSGLREGLGRLSLCDGDRLLKEKQPAYVLRIGEVPVGRFWRDLEELRQVKVVSVSRTGFSGLARESSCIQGDIPRSIRALGDVFKVGDTQDWLVSSKRRRGRISELLESYPESEPGMMRLLSVNATVGGSIYLGNSLPIREWNDFAQRDVPYEMVRANRGANGIDGQIASWLGATADEEDAWAIIGDLTALYDFSAPSLISQVEQKGRVLAVINNGGGKIFSRLPSYQSLDAQTAEMIINPHEQDFTAWAQTWDMDYHKITGIEGFDFEAGEKTLLLEIVPDARQTETFWSRWNEIF